MAHAALVRKGTFHAGVSTSPASLSSHTSTVTTGSREDPPSLVQAKADPFSCIRESLCSAGLSKQVANVIDQAWSESTKKQYRSYLQKWMYFCDTRKIDSMCASVNQVLEFLAQLHGEGLGYSGVNTAKSAVFMFLSASTQREDYKDSWIIQKFMKGVFASKPALPRYNVTWDTEVVLKYLKSQSPPEALTLLALSRKLATLLILLSGQRGQTIHLLDIRFLERSTEHLILRASEPLKTTKPGNHLAEIVLPAYDTVPGLCVV